MKRAVVVAVIVVAIVAAAILAAPFLVPDSFLKQRLADAITGLTGREVTLAGDVNLTVYPHLTVAVEDVTVANPQGTDDDPFVAVEELRARVRLLPLLAARVEFDQFDLINPRIHIVDGDEANWRLTGGVAEAAARPSSAPDAPPPPTVSIGRIVVTNGTLLFDDRASGRHEEMSGLALDVSWPDTDTAASGRGTLTWRDETLEFTALIASPTALMRGEPSALRFAIASTPLRATFTGKAIRIVPLELDGQAEVSTPSLRHMISLFGTDMGNGAILGAAAISGAASWNAGSIAFDKAKMELDGNAAEGTLTFRFDGERPNVQGTLAADKLDLSPYVEAAQASLAAAGSWLMAPADVSFAQTFDADLRVSAGSIVVGAMSAGKTAAALAIRNGALDLSIGESEYHGGTVAARINTTTYGDELAGSVHLALTGVPAEAALFDLAGVTALSGTATATFDLQSRANLWGGFAGSVTGTGTVAITDGALDGIDVAATAAAMKDPLAEPNGGVAGTTPFKSLTATLSVDSGRLVTSDLTLVGDAYAAAVTGKGSVLSQAIDAEADVAAGQDVVQLVLSGTWQKPTIARASAPLLPQAPPTPAEPPKAD